MKISVASGKGGTGKTLFATNLALSLSNKLAVSLLDCDVEEPNDHFFLGSVFAGSQEVSVPVPEIDESRCNHCGICAQVCAFHALAVFPDWVVTFPNLCHGCGACRIMCPRNAIIERERTIGLVEWGRGSGIECIRGTLVVGEALVPPLIREVKKRYRNGHSDGVAILDSPPGTSCAMVETVKDSDVCVLVTEPTPFGVHDLILAIGVVQALNIPSGVVVNKTGIGKERIDEVCGQAGIPLLMTIPFDERIARCTVRGIPLVREAPEWKSRFRECAGKIKEIAG